MRGLLVILCAVCFTSGTDLTSTADRATELGHIKPNTCVDCAERHIVNVDKDFNKLETDPELKKHVSAILERLKTFKLPVHPRVRLFYELLKLGMREHAHRTADSLYVPDKYSIAHGATYEHATTQ